MDRDWESLAFRTVEPGDLKIILPAPDLPDEIKSLSGKWEGVWEVRANPKIYPRPCVLIFEKISSDGTAADIFYITEGWKPDRRQAVISGNKGKVIIGFANFTFTLKGGTLASERTYSTAQGTYTWNIVMKKVP